MPRSEIETVLANWIAQTSPEFGKLADGVDPASWVAKQFLTWWQPRVEESLADAERAIEAARTELVRLGGWNDARLGEALHELTHATDAISDLRTAYLAATIAKL